MKKIDDKAKHALMKHTTPPEKMKDEIWNRLDNELFNEEIKPEKVHTMKLRILPALFAAAAVLLLVFSFGTDTGLALIDRIKELFEPEKQAVQSIEGTDEKNEVQLNEGKNAEYVIYIDEERYKMIKGAGDEPDVITTKEPLPEKFPEVSMTIEQVPDTAPDVLVGRIEEELKAEFPDLREVEQVEEPVAGYQLHGIANGGQAWDDPVVHAYVIRNGNGGSYVITERYFLEAAEGHGARFYAMLQEFHIVGAQE
ncbi:hypothetical protein [Planococcus chinensis]|uniref:DUF4367 domain-containing protein n=1 Tax=Planococcus chinensis TaxID=272917 RepID=A0ABW4QLK0_9BACL